MGLFKSKLNVLKGLLGQIFTIYPINKIDGYTMK